MRGLTSVGTKSSQREVTLPPTHAGLQLASAISREPNEATHMRTGLTFTSSTDFGGIGVDARHARGLRCTLFGWAEFCPANSLMHLK